MPTIHVNPILSPDQIFGFYLRNAICESEYGRDEAARILDHPHLIVAALDEGEIVALARATFDGLSACVMEFSLDLRWQGETQYGNGSLLESDPKGLGAAIGNCLLDELRQRGCRFISCSIVAGAEEAFYRSIGFRENEGHLVYYIDERPYVVGRD